MAGEVDREFGETGQQWARLVGFLMMLGAAILSMAYIVVAWFFSYDVGDGLNYVWIALLGIAPIATVGVFAFGWLRGWPGERCIVASLAGLVAVFTTTSLILATGGEGGLP